MAKLGFETPTDLAFAFTTEDQARIAGLSAPWALARQGSLAYAVSSGWEVHEAVSSHREVRPGKRKENDMSCGDIGEARPCLLLQSSEASVFVSLARHQPFIRGRLFDRSAVTSLCGPEDHFGLHLLTCKFHLADTDL